MRDDGVVLDPVISISGTDFPFFGEGSILPRPRLDGLSRRGRVFGEEGFTPAVRASACMEMALAALHIKAGW